MVVDAKVEVRGLKELNKAFRQIDTTVDDELKVAFKAIAQAVVEVAQSGMPSKSGKAKRSVKPRGTKRGASIAFGGNAAPYMPWLDFGGSVGRGHRPGKAWSGAIKRDWKGVPTGEGRYVYPAIRAKRDDTADAAEDAVQKAAEHAGFDVRGD